MEKISKFFKTKPKNKKEKDTGTPNSDAKDVYYTYYDTTPPVLPKTPIPTQRLKGVATGKTFSKDAIGELPLQHVSSNRRMEEYSHSTPNSDAKDVYYTYYDTTPPVLPKTPIPTQRPKGVATGKTFSKDAIGELPLQHVSSNRRMEDLDDDEYGYTTGGAIYNKQKKKKINLEETYMDAHEFVPYRKDSHTPMISRCFFSKESNYGEMSVAKVCQEMDHSEGDKQQDLKKFITVHLLPSLKLDNKLADVFILLSCRDKLVKSLCIQEMTKMISNIDYRRFSKEDLMSLYETGMVQLFTAISETKKTFSIFQPLIQLGIMFNCFIYLKAVEAMDDWIACIRRVMSTMQSKTKRVMERSDPDVQVFVKTAQCIFDLENVNLENSLLLGEDMEDFLPEFSHENSDIYIEGLAAVFHTGNLILRQQSKLKAGVQKLVGLSSFMNGSNDDGMVKWFHRLLGQFVVRILQQEHTDIKLDVLDRCEDQLFTIMKNETFHSEGFDLSQCLLFHHNDRVRSRYKDVAKANGLKISKAVTEVHIQTLLNKFGLVFDVSTSESHLNSIVERKQCTFCNVEASITIIYETVLEETTDVNMYDNTSKTISPVSESQYKIENLENELEVLKELESNDFHINVARLLAFNQSFPKFYIKERLPGDNLQRRLLEAREKGKTIQIVDLIWIIIQALQAVIYVHSQGCLLRDITTASYGCTVSDDGYFCKLKNFEIATKASDFSDGGIVSGIIDLDCKGVPTRWAAPESLLEGHYSIYSDVWSVNILVDEILNYAAWPYSDISDADINDMVTHIVFTHLKPQGFNRPRRVQGLILEGLATVPEQRLKLEALRERLLEILDNIDGGDSYSLYDTYTGAEGTRTRTYDIPPLTERQKQANSVFERGIPESIQKYRELEDPETAFAMEVAENNSRLKKQTGLKVMEIFSDEKYKIESEDTANKIKVMESVTEDFLRFTYKKLNEIDSSKMCVEPWPPSKSAPTDGLKLHYRFPKSTHLLDVVLHRNHGETIGPYIELLYELANHVDAFHSAGWIFRCLRAKNVWILDTKKKEQNIVLPKFGKYRMIMSSEFDAHLEQIKVDSKEDMEDVQWLPIEAIKAGLYSKESDVYAFGMVTWEVMAAFGQEGVVYHQDEERELTCIPFNYQQSENILQHLIEGYIPEKPLKCPDWFYQEVTRRCLLHQKIDRPSMKTILQVLETRLGKTLPKQILSPPPPALDTSKSSDEYEDIYEEDVEQSDFEVYAVNPPEKIHSLPSSALEKSKDSDEYDDIDDDCAISSPMLFQSEVDKSNTSMDKDTGNPPVVLRRPPPPLSFSNYDTDGKESHIAGRQKPPLPPPSRQYPLEKKPDMSDCFVPPVPRRDRDTTKTQESEDDSGCDNCPLVPKRPPPVVLSENKEDSANLPEVNSCKSLPLPMTPPQSDDRKDQDVKCSQLKPIPPIPAIKDTLNSDKNFPLPPRPPKPNYTKGDLKSLQTHDGKSFAPPNNNMISGSKPSPDQREENITHVDSVNGGSGFDGTAPNVVCDDLKDTFKGSDLGSSDNVSIGLGDTHKGSDFNSSDNLGDTHKGSDFNSSDNLGDTHKGSDFNSSDNLDDTHKGSDIDRTVRVETDTDLSVEPSSPIKTNPEDFSEPKANPKSNSYVNVDFQERKSDDTHTVVYVNQNQPETKPAVPPRKPLN